ncbi:MAG: acetoacetate decarboxylase family protein [Dehalococcoidia bacterium]|nr:acetoacetate decarboxylase family protein [Dehalococcoidia bacterium]NUQ56700.1 acetoacetate decarboxylase family protein [Dehalococcoidia bacterium]RIL01691.1 MAG: acetoacetate decarboxylase [bacterium]
MSLTRYLKSPEEMRRLQDVLAAPSFFDIHSLAVTFASDPDVLAELLPPPLEPAESPQVSVGVFEIGRSNCVGPFAGAAVNIACRYRGEDGFYCVTMPMNTGLAVTFGRELFAEPKKLAEVSLEVRDGTARGRVTRQGVTYIELTGRFEGPPAEAGLKYVTPHYYFRFLPAANGRGLAYDPELIRVTHRGTVHRSVPGEGTVTFRESHHDPVIDIPVLSVTGATLSVGESRTSAEVVTTVPASEFLPYAYGKIDDLLEWAEEPASAPA